MRTVGLPGVGVGGVSRREGWSAPGRSDYQMGIEHHRGIPQAKERGGQAVTHVRQWLMLPEGIDPITWTRAEIWKAAQEAEIRHDAREGRYYDVGWPRELPTEDIDAVVETLYRPFVDMGLVVQVDWESSLAEDGDPNDHLHGLISTRVLSNEGFASGKLRELDVWFRSGVRRRVAEMFNSIAEAHKLDVTFDPRPNVERDDALPPEERLPRQVLRQPLSRDARASLERRASHRRIRREHEQVVAQIGMLEQQVLDRQTDIEAGLDDMATLTSLQMKDAAPLTLEAAMALLMRAGIEVADRAEAGDIGLALVIDGTTLVDTGNRILVEGRLAGDALRAIHLLARHKGWRDLSLADAFGMPLPVLTMPSARERSVRTEAVQVNVEVPGNHSVAAAVGSIMRDLQEEPGNSREVLDRVARWGNPNLERMIARLVVLADKEDPDRISTETVQHMVHEAMGGRDELWGRFRLEQDLEAMTLPGNPLARPFRPHPRYYDHYGASGSSGKEHDYRGGGEDEQ